MKTSEFYELIGVFLGIQTLGITIIVFLMKQTRQQIQDLRREMNEKFTSCQKLCGNEMKHMDSSVRDLRDWMKEFDNRIRVIWEEVLDRTYPQLKE